MTHLPALAPHLLKLSVVLTPQAWESAVQWDEHDGADITVLRLCRLLLTVYRHLNEHPEQQEILFGCYPRGRHSTDPKHRWLGLRLTQKQASDGSLNRPGFSRHLASSLRNVFQTLPATADC